MMPGRITVRDRNHRALVVRIEEWDILGRPKKLTIFYEDNSRGAGRAFATVYGEEDVFTVKPKGDA